MGCQYAWECERCLDRECEWYRGGGGPCDGETYTPSPIYGWPLGQGRWLPAQLHD